MSSVAKAGFWKYFRSNLRYAAMVTTLTFTSVALTAFAYEFVTNEDAFRQELDNAKETFSLVDNFKMGATRREDSVAPSSSGSRLRAQQSLPAPTLDSLKAQLDRTIKLFTSGGGSDDTDKPAKDEK